VLHFGAINVEGAIVTSELFARVDISASDIEPFVIARAVYVKYVRGLRVVIKPSVVEAQNVFL
jgi:hypothetical protein